MNLEMFLSSVRGRLAAADGSVEVNVMSEDWQQNVDDLRNSAFDDLSKLLEIVSRQHNFISALASGCTPPFEDMSAEDMDQILTDCARTALADVERIVKNEI